MRNYQTSNFHADNNFWSSFLGMLEFNCSFGCYNKQAVA